MILGSAQRHDSCTSIARNQPCRSDCRGEESPWPRLPARNALRGLPVSGPVALTRAHARADQQDQQVLIDSHVVIVTGVEGPGGGGGCRVCRGLTCTHIPWYTPKRGVKILHVLWLPQTATAATIVYRAHANSMQDTTSRRLLEACRSLHAVAIARRSLPMALAANFAWFTPHSDYFQRSVNPFLQTSAGPLNLIHGVG